MQPPYIHCVGSICSNQLPWATLRPYTGLWYHTTATTHKPQGQIALAPKFSLCSWEQWLHGGCTVRIFQTPPGADCSSRLCTTRAQGAPLFGEQKRQWGPIHSVIFAVANGGFCDSQRQLDGFRQGSRVTGGGSAVVLNAPSGRSLAQ